MGISLQNRIYQLSGSLNSPSFCCLWRGDEDTSLCCAGGAPSQKGTLEQAEEVGAG